MLALICLLLVSAVNPLNNGLARTPPMGWLSWLRFGCTTNCNAYPNSCISDKLFRRIADSMSSDGYLEAGYKYLIIDDCWLANTRDANGRLQPDPERFPQGMKDLGNYIHSKGLKYGLYEDIGTKTCEGYPGVQDHFEIDMQTFADWGVDYTKIDGCYANTGNFSKSYPELGLYLNKTGRPIVYSCSWPAYLKNTNYTPIAEACNLWRNYGDISNSYSSLSQIIMWFKTNQDKFASVAGPGNWNDPDMLIIGDSGLTVAQSKVQMAIWAIMAAPLIMSVDLKTIHPEYKDTILLNKEAIAVNQDKLGIQGLFVETIDDVDVWVRPITPVIKDAKSFAIAFHNTNELESRQIGAKLANFGVAGATSYSVKHIFSANECIFKLVGVNEEFKIKLEPTSVALLKFTPHKF